MAADGPAPGSSLALNTTVERDFVSPLTAVRGALEILRDYPDLADAERRQFVETALSACARLERGIAHLAETVYAAGEEGPPAGDNVAAAEQAAGDAGRVRFDADENVAEVSLAGLRFSNSAEVNAFYDRLERRVEISGRKWYFLIDYSGLSIWPEAWVAFAHRAKKVHATCALATVRFAEPRQDGAGAASDGSDPDYLESREAARARIEALKQARDGG